MHPKPRQLPWLAAILLAASLSQPGSAQDPPAAPSAEVRAFLRAWANDMRDVRSLIVEFTQTKHLRLLRKPRVSSGTTWLKGPRLRMRVRRGDRTELELLVANDEARLYHPAQARVEVYPLRDGAPPPAAPFPFFSSDVEGLPERFAIELRREEDGRDLLLLTPKDPGAQTKLLRMWFREGRIAEVEQTSRRGDRVRMQITRFDVNASVSEDDVQVEVPDDVEVVRGTPR